MTGRPATLAHYTPTTIKEPAIGKRVEAFVNTQPMYTDDGYIITVIRFSDHLEHAYIDEDGSKYTWEDLHNPRVLR
jgi:hypothetical protein